MSSSLYLTPGDNQWLNLDPAKTISVLESLGFIGKRIPTNESSAIAFYAGDEFLKYISFMGCSPNISFSESESESFTHVCIHNDNTEQFITGKNTVTPRCPACNKAYSKHDSLKAGGSLTCPACDNTLPINNWRWRRSAGFGYFFIEITDIFPGEAIPQPELLDALERNHNTTWIYFYIQHS